ncbi:hypothetical protein BU15DRAFT_67384 [Melanogaster broomeanus]|nr:hypothetical protein BU15DRAFT_67384 [Melanogaster broomeanus]
MSATSLAAVARDLMQAPLMGSFIALVLYGVTTIQTFFYFQTYPDDHGSLKLMVQFGIVPLVFQNSPQAIRVDWFHFSGRLETIHSGLNISFINHYLIDSFGDVDALLSIPWDMIFVITFIVNFHSIFVDCSDPADNPSKGMLTATRFGTRSFTACKYYAHSIVALATTSVILGAIYHDSWAVFRDHAYVPLITVMATGDDRRHTGGHPSCYAFAGRTFRNISVNAIVFQNEPMINRKPFLAQNRLINRLLAYTVGTGAFTASVIMEIGVDIITDREIKHV